jgi:excisionase family DNA binding protein
VQREGWTEDDTVTQEFLTVAQAADLIGQSQSTIRRKIRERRLRAVRVGTNPRGPLRIEADELKRHLTAARRQTSSAALRSSNGTYAGGNGRMAQSEGARVATTEIPRLLTSTEVAAILRVSQRRVTQLVGEGVLDAVRFHATARYRFRVEDVERLIRPRSVRGEA